jgi:hypothetical protein
VAALRGFSGRVGAGGGDDRPYPGAVGELTRKLRAYRRIFRRAGPTVPPDLARVLRHRPPTLLGVAAYELSLVASGTVDARLKTLAALQASAQVGCPF